MNPFSPSKIAAYDNFVGRKQELKELELKLSSSNSERLLLLAPRRFGKTSLLLKLISNLIKKKNFICIYMDIFACSNIDDFANHLVESIVTSQNLSSLEKLSRWVKTNLLELRANLKIQADLEGHISVEPIVYRNYNSAVKQIRDAFADMDKLGKNKHLILFIDEFQTILDWDNKYQLEAELRTITQKLDNVNIVFSGSHLRLLKDIFETSSRPFFKQVNKFYLDKIDPDLVAKWIQSSFKKEKINISESLVIEIIDFSKNIPQQFQYICYEIWNEAKLNDISTVDSKFFRNLIAELIIKKRGDFELLWSQLSINQKDALKALANKKDEAGLYSKEFLIKSALTASTLQSCINTLEDKYLIVNYNKSVYIPDSLFERWIIEG